MSKEKYNKYRGYCRFEGTLVGARPKLCTNAYNCGKCEYYQVVIEPRLDQLKKERQEKYNEIITLEKVIKEFNFFETLSE